MRIQWQNLSNGNCAQAVHSRACSWQRASPHSNEGVHGAGTERVQLHQNMPSTPRPPTETGTQPAATKRQCAPIRMPQLERLRS